MNQRNDMNRQIDQLCDRFETQWGQGNRLSIASLVAELPFTFRSEALYELIRLEVALRTDGGEAPTVNDYLQRFPDDHHFVSQAFLESRVDIPGLAETGECDLGEILAAKLTR